MGGRRLSVCLSVCLSGYTRAGAQMEKCELCGLLNSSKMKYLI